MDKKEKKNILIVGSSAAAYAVAKRFASYDNVEKVYAASGNAAMKEFAEVVDIRENNVNELLEFALENSVDLTVAVSTKAIKADIANVFQQNSQQIFAPAAKSAQFALSRSFSKKFLYKLHIPTPRFGIFEKSSIAMDYLTKSQMPVIISTDELSDASIMAVCSTMDCARRCVDDISMYNEEKFVVEEYVYGHNFTVYVITDGYNALPLAVCADYKFLEDGEGGLYTCGSGAFAPDYKVSQDVLSAVMNNLGTIFSYLENGGEPYMGILGVECVLKDNGDFVTTGFTPFLKDHDAQVVLNSLDENLYTLFEACAVGSFADDYEKISLKNTTSAAVVLFSRKDGNCISGLDLIDDTTEVSHFATAKNELFEYETNKGRTLVVTQQAATLSSARKLLYENTDVIRFEGKKYRSDICR